MKTHILILFLSFFSLSAVVMKPNASAADRSNTDIAEDFDLNFSMDEASANEIVIGADGTMSINFPDEDVRNILRNVADVSDLNLVMPNDLTGSASIKLRNVTWRQVFHVALEPLGYTYIEDRNIIRIQNIASLRNEPVVTRVFLINYAIAGEIKNALLPLADTSKGGRIQVDKRTNAILVTERPSRMNDIQSIINRLDRPTPQVFIDVKLFEIVNRQQGGIGQTASSNNPSSTNRTADNANEATKDSSDGMSGDTKSDSIDIEEQKSAIYSPHDADQLLSTLEAKKGARLVSTMNVVVLDSEDAKIEMVKHLPVPHLSFNETQGSYVVDGFEYQAVDISLQVRPEVNSAGYIRLSIAPKVSSRIGETSFSGQSNRARIPLISSKSMSSEVLIKDGYTLLIGGVGETISRVATAPQRSGPPPSKQAVEHAFEEMTTGNFIIFVTARTLNPDGTTYLDTADPHVMHQMGIVETDLPGYTMPEQ